MRKISYIILVLICTFFSLTGCISKKEEAMAVITEIPCEQAGVRFSLNGLWVIQEETETTVNERQTVAFSAYKEESGSGIQVICEDLSQTEGGTLVRMNDYVIGLKEQLESSNDYQYSSSEITTENLCGNNYETFTVSDSELGGKQQYYIRRQEDTIIIMVITIFGEDNQEDILSIISSI